MAYGQLGMVLLIVIFLWMFVTILLPPLIVVAFNLILMGMALRQMYTRWFEQTHYWYEMGVFFAFLIAWFYHHLTPFWAVTEFIVLAVLIAEALQWVERYTT